MTELEQLKAENEYFKKKLAIGEYDLAYKGYLSFVKIVQQQVEFLDNFILKVNIEGKKTETVMYERAESLWNKLPATISSLNSLKAELKIEYDPNEGKPRVGGISPQNIGGL
jgi:hypothetical protein